jgi:hypothetical protein
MATKADTSKSPTFGTAVLERLAKLKIQDISPETARDLLHFRFETSHHERVNFLSEKAQRGTLTPSEQSDLDEYIRVGTLLGILQSKARQILKNSGKAP